MLSERRFNILVHAMWAEMLTLWNHAHLPEWRLPTAIVEERQRKYFRYRLKEALEALALDSEPLAEVLVEIHQVATGAEQVVGWEPPPLAVGPELLMPL